MKTQSEQTPEQFHAMSFGAALAALRDGQRVARAGWNGKGMFLFYVGENEWRLPDTAVDAGRILPLSPFIALRTADAKVVPWLPSQTDLLAWDWCVVRSGNDAPTASA